MLTEIRPEEEHGRVSPLKQVCQERSGGRLGQAEERIGFVCLVRLILGPKRVTGAVAETWNCSVMKMKVDS